MAAATSTRRQGAFRRLYRGESRIDFIGPRRRWYLASAIIILICVGSMAFRGFNFGIEFAGGNQYLVPVKPGTSLTNVRAEVEGVGVQVASVQIAGTGASQQYVVRTGKPKNQQQDAAQIVDVKQALVRAANVTVADVTTNEVSSSWGAEITQQAIYALIVFVLAVSVFMWIRFKEIKVAAAAVLALIHDLLLTAGVYSLVGFEVTPGTVVGLLTILGYSLYDTVVVFDKVDENTRSLLAGSRYTYPEAANLAVNQTLMRSINTSLIGLLPVAGLLFIGAGIFGVGTLEDLALVLFVGMLTGAYSSLFLATPWLVDFKMTDPRYRNHAQRLLAKRSSEAAKAAGRASAASATAGPARSAAGTAEPDDTADSDDLQSRIDALAGAPRPGAKAPAKPPAKRAPAGRSTRPGTKRHR